MLLHREKISALKDGIKMMAMLMDLQGPLSNAVAEWKGGFRSKTPMGEYDIHWHAGRLLAINELLGMVNYGDIWSVMCYVARGDCSLVEMLRSNKDEFSVFVSTGGHMSTERGGISSDMLSFAVQFSNSFLVCWGAMKGFVSMTMHASWAMELPCVCDISTKTESSLHVEVLLGLSHKKLDEWSAQENAKEQKRVAEMMRGWRGGRE